MQLNAINTERLVVQVTESYKPQKMRQSYFFFGRVRMILIPLAQFCNHKQSKCRHHEMFECREDAVYKLWVCFYKFETVALTLMC